MKRYLFTISLCAILLIPACHTPGRLSGVNHLNKDHQEKAFHFFIFGDWGRRGSFDQKQVANQMRIQARKFNPAFILSMGDNFYEDGVTSITDTHWKESYNDIYKELTGIDWYVTLGNHDYRGSVQAEIDYHSVNPHWNMPDRYYTTVINSADGQKIRLICIDTSPYYKDYYTNPKMTAVKTQDTAAQRRWLETTLANAKEPWKFVFGHHPAYSAALRGGTPDLLAMLKPLMDKYHVQAYICGHDHNLQHNRPTGSYTDYFVSGAGSEVKDGNTFNPALFAASTPGFGDITLQHDSLYLNFINENGKIIYHYARSK